jgi:hypothetical protein
MSISLFRCRPISPFLPLFLGQRSPPAAPILPGPHSSINLGEAESKKEWGSVPTTQEDLEKIRENNNNQCGGEGEEEGEEQPSPPKNQAGNPQKNCNRDITKNCF